jgi:hypothetical protein
VYHDNRRLHSALGYQTPRQIEAQPNRLDCRLNPKENATNMPIDSLRI